uniref:AN1-type zinc finger protein 1 n=1 Tax=Cacopsylla melanoneura TaxID=428564 RepID=A0A8D8YBS0_9HEMI
MELPHLGKQCGESTCKQLDFLPFQCDLCKCIYCKEHMSPVSHNCSEYKDNVLLEKPTTTSIVSYKCSASECSALDQVEMVCENCARHFCVSHRFHECHQVDTNPRKQLREQWKQHKAEFKQAKLVAEKQIESTLAKAEVQTSNRGLALKLRLMKLKAKAVGDHRVPTVDRIYFNVHGPRLAPPSPGQETCKPVYVSCDWSLGKVIDFAAAKLKVLNENKTAGGSGLKLKLFKADGKIVGGGEFAKVLGECVKTEEVYSGENLILEKTSEVELKDVDGYEFVV